MPAELAAEVSRAAGLRNRLAHAYDTIDDAVLFRAVPLALIQLRRYGAYVNSSDPPIGHTAPEDDIL